jgi:ribosome maturation factor RimP
LTTCERVVESASTERQLAFLREVGSPPLLLFWKEVDKMATQALESRLSGLLEPRAAENGLELVAVEVAGAQNAPLVRVFLDREDGISIDAIAQASHWIQELLDADPDLACGYTLEASSPGIDRPLRKPADYERFAGSRVKVTTKRAVDGRRHFTGTLVGLDGDSIVLDLDGTKHTIPLDEVDKAGLRAEIDFNREAPDGI